MFHVEPLHGLFGVSDEIIGFQFYGDKYEALSTLVFSII